MKIIERIFKTASIIVVMVVTGSPQAFPQFFINKGAKGQIGRADSKAFKKAAKQLLDEIKEEEKKVYNLLKEDAPEKVKEKHLEQFRMYVSQRNAFIVECGLEPYKSSLLEQSEISVQGGSSQSNEQIDLTADLRSGTIDEDSHSTREEIIAEAPVNKIKSSDKDEISLTVTSDGLTKDDAIKNALRTAIEQAYGAFVSANTTILNDELVRDEIVTVSNGSIKEYKILSEYEKADGSGYSVTANATVSLPHLITYAKNHGSECEFAGNTFGMEMKLFNLQKENELKAIYNLIPTVRNLCRTSMKWTMKVDEPYVLGVNDAGLCIDGDYCNRICENPVNRIIHISKSSLDSRFSDVFQNPQSYCVIHFDLYWNRIGKDNQIANYLYDALSKIGLDRDSYEYLEKKGHSVSSFSKNTLWFCSNVDDEMDEYKGYYFRNNRETLIKALMEINNVIRDEKLNFHILDNTGEYSDFSPREFVTYVSSKHFKQLEDLEIETPYNMIGQSYSSLYKLPASDIYFTGLTDCNKNSFLGINGSGLFNNLFYIRSLRDNEDCFYWNHSSNCEVLYVFDDYKKTGAEEMCQNLSNDPSFSIYVIVPMSELGKYSSFKVVAKE